MAKGEGGNATVVRLTAEQREREAQKKAAVLAAREERIARQNRDKMRAMTSKAKFSLTTDQARVEQVKTLGPLQRLYAHCERLKRTLTNKVWRLFMLRSGYAATLLFAGTFTAQCVGADGVVKWTTGMEFNQITTEGLNYLLDVGFHNGTQVATWYIGLVDTGGSYAAGNLASQIATTGSANGWNEYTEYSETLRQTWTEDAAASGSITNSTTVDFSMNASGTVAGMFLVSTSTKGGTSGTLWTVLNFSGGNQTVSNGDTLKVTYTLTASA